MTAVTILNISKPTDKTYSVGSVAYSVSLPTYSWTLNQATTSFAYEIVGGPTFVAISDSPLQIII